MAIAGSDFVVKKRAGIAPGLKMVILEWTGPASYAAAGEVLTRAIVDGWGIKQIHALQVTPLVDDDGAAGAVGFMTAFDHTPTGATNHGKLRVLNSGLAAHTHDIKIIGGTAAAGTDAVNVKTAILGKEAATDATVAGADSATKGGVVATTVDEHAGDVATATNLSAFKARLIVWGA